MIKSIVVTNFKGESIALELFDPEASGMAIISIDGLGPATATINTSALATIDGAIYNSARVGTRNIVLTLAFLEKATIEEVRLLTYKYFPVKKRVTLEIETDARRVVTYGYVESNDPNIFSKQQTTQISILCPDAYFYSAENGGINTTAYYEMSPMFTFPFENIPLAASNLVMGEITQTTVGKIYYNGDFETGMYIHMYIAGPVTSLSIYNLLTGAAMDIDTAKITTLTGSALGAGDEIFISTTKGEKSITLIRGAFAINIINSLNRNASWLMVEPGENIIGYSAVSGIENVRVMIENRTVYEGV